MWILLNAGTDFKKSKASAADVITGVTSPDKLRKAFRAALLQMQGSTPLDVNPTDFKIPGSDITVFNDVEALKTPIMIFKDIFINSDAQAVLALAKRVFPVSDDMEINIIADIATAKGDYTKVTGYGVFTMGDDSLFDKNFRTFFKADPALPPVEVSRKTELMDILRSNLSKAVEKGNASITIPTFTRNNK